MPIEPHLYATFVLASIALALLPGPIVTLVVANALAHGTRTGVETAFGSCIGNAILATASALGLVALLGLIGDIFDVLRWGRRGLSDLARHQGLAGRTGNAG